MQLMTVDGDEWKAGATLLTITMPKEIAAATGIQPVVQVAVVSGSISEVEEDIQGAVAAVDALLRIRLGIGE